VLFATGASRLRAFWGDAASLLFATSLFAALLSFHNAVARYGFALAGKDPVLSLFTWLTNLGALGVLLLMAVTSFAVVAYFRRSPDSGVSTWASTIAPAIAGVLLLIVLVLGVLNFNVLITGSTDAPTDSMAIVLPLILFGGGVLGLLLGAVLRRSRPEIFARIGAGGAELQGSAHDR
jgi:hypothetical protein